MVRTAKSQPSWSAKKNILTQDMTFNAWIVPFLDYYKHEREKPGTDGT